MIDDIVHTYEKYRKEFGKPMLSLKEETKPIGGLPHDEARAGFYTAKNPKNITLGNIPEFTEHEVRIYYINRLIQIK